MIRLIKNLLITLCINSVLYCQSPIAEGQNKFLGNVYSYDQVTDFTAYWNQVTPEDAGKWGSVEVARDVMNWGELDNAYNLAKNNGFPFRLHVLIWGNQQPQWIVSLDSAEQHEEIEEWFSEVANRYNDMDYIEVVNEPLHDPPDDAINGGGNYIQALGGAGSSGWDWVINAFKMARQYFPESKLIINDYSIINNLSTVNNYLEIINLLKADTLIDGIGFQAHAFNTKTTPATTMKNNLDALAAAGLPIYVTEMDIDGPTDLVQINEYQRVFPVFWEHPAVEGITLWGWRPGLWRDDQGAYIVSYFGKERPALKWLKAYVNDTFVIATDVILEPESGVSEITTSEGQLKIIPTFVPYDATINNILWSVNDIAIGKISSNGTVTAASDGILTVTATLLDGSGITKSIDIAISNQNITPIEQPETHNGNLLIYPDPSEDYFTIETGQKITQIEVYNFAGELVRTIPGSDKNQIYIEHCLNTGVYLIRVSTLKNVYTKKIIIS